MDGLDAVDVDDGRAVHAGEPARVEALLQRGHGLAQFVGVLAHVQAHAVAVGFDPVDARHVQQDHAAVHRDRQAARIALLAPQFRQGLPDLRRRGLPAFSRQPPPGAAQHGVEALAAEGLDQIVHRIGLERAYCVLLIDGDEDRGGQRVLAERGGHVDAGHLGHLDIEENQSGRIASRALAPSPNSPTIANSASLRSRRAMLCRAIGSSSTISVRMLRPRRQPPGRCLHPNPRVRRRRGDLVEKKHAYGPAACIRHRAVTAAAQTRYLEIYNDAPASMVALAAAPAGGDGYRDLAIGDRPLPGGGHAVTVELDGREGCRRDLRARFADGRVLVSRGFDICRYRSYHTARALPR